MSTKKWTAQLFQTSKVLQLDRRQVLGFMVDGKKYDTRELGFTGSKKYRDAGGQWIPRDIQ